MLLKKLKETTQWIAQKTKLKPKTGMTLGSGLAAFGDSINIDVCLPYSEIPHFCASGVEGHPGNLIIGDLNGHEVALLQGRIHFYEGYSLEEVTFPTRALAQLGIENLVLTNAAGGLNPNMTPGDFMIIKDHMNLTGQNPLIGPNLSSLGLRFPDMSEAYHPKLILMLKNAFEASKVQPHEGVYCGLTGPTYETPAEVKYLQTVGGDAVGMSTVFETIVARHMGLNVCGVSCITNFAAGITSQKISHDEVKEIGKKVEKIFSQTLTHFTQSLHDNPL